MEDDVYTIMPGELWETNTNTILPPAPLPAATATAPRPAELARTRETLMTQTLFRPGSGRVRLGLRHGSGFRHVDLPLDPDQYVVLGRHTHSDLRLAGDEAISLRQLMVLSRRRDGQDSLELLSLDSHIDIQLADGTRMPSCRVLHDTSFRVRDHELHVVGLGAPADPQDRDSCRRASIPAPAPHISAGELPSDGGDGRGMTIRARSERGEHESTVPPGALERGVVIGRAKCFDEQLASVLSQSSSRAHLLVRLEAGDAYAYDLCSSWGTHQRGGRVRRVRLDPQGTRLIVGHPDDPTELDIHAGPR